MSILNDDQARLLDAYTDALARDRDAPPPDGLDPEFAALARHLAAHAAPEPTASTLADIRARILTPQPPDSAHNGQYSGAWTFTPLSMRAQATPPPPSRMMERSVAPATFAAPAATPPPMAPPQPSAAPPPAARTPPAITPARRPSLPTRLAGIVLGTLIALIALSVLIVSLVVFRPPVGQGTTPSATPSVPAVVCGFAPPAIQPTPPSGSTATIAAQSPLMPTPTSLPRDLCTRRHPDLLTLDQAASIVRALIDQPDAEFYAVYLTAASPDQDTIILEHPIPPEAESIATVDHVELNARSGMLLAFSYVSRESLSVPAEPIAESEAVARGESFVREQYPELDRLTQRSVQYFGGAYPKTEVVWQLRAGDTGAWLPTAIRVSVSRRTGLVIGYWRVEEPYNGPTEPLISETEAQERVLAVAHQDPRYTDLTITDTTLWVAAPQQMNNANTDFRLLWTITLANPPQGALGERLIPSWYVDALTGEVIAATGGG